MQAPEYLNKVNSDRKALEVAAILDACHPTHAQRLFLVGFLRYCGYPMSEVTKIIHDHNHWCDYSERITSYQVASVFHQTPQRTQNHSASRPTKWSLTQTEILRIKYQRSVALSRQLCEENKSIEFAHPERLAFPKFNPSAEFLRK